MENQTELKWYQKPTGVIILLIFFFPVGLYLMWKNKLWTKRTRWIVTGVLALIIIANAGKSSQSACDCANLYDNSPMRKEYTPQQLNDADFLRKEADEYVEQAKNCAIKYGNLTEMEKELARTTLEMNMIPKLDQAIGNAKKECATKKEFNKNELEIACDCWNQSVEKSGMAFDDMNSTQQAFRQKCFKVFGDEASMKAACENASKK